MKKNRLKRRIEELEEELNIACTLIKALTQGLNEMGVEVAVFQGGEDTGFPANEPPSQPLKTDN